MRVGVIMCIWVRFIRRSQILRIVGQPAAAWVPAPRRAYSGSAMRGGGRQISVVACASNGRNRHNFGASR